jgi:N,N'-diacetyllegionaminate synthase
MSKTKIIAEIGVNHNGDIDLAKQLILEAQKCGANYVKFQTYKVENLVMNNAEKAEYQKINTNTNQNQFEMLEKLQFNKDQFWELKLFCDMNNIKFLSSPFDLASVRLLDDFDMDYWKIPSGEITNYPFLKEISKTKKPIIMSTGMSYLEEIKSSLDIFYKNNYKKSMITVLHCTTAYPCTIENVNLNCIKTLQNELKVNVGLSDHSEGIIVSICSIPLGVKVIEKHFTLDKSMEGPDHKASLEPKEFEEMVKQIRYIEKALGSFVKKPSKSEFKNIQMVRKSIVAKENISKGDYFTEDNITTKRPGTGLSPMDWQKIIGKKSIKDFKKDELIKIKNII